MINTGNAYETGNGVEQNAESAFEWYLKAAETCRVAQYNVGLFYEAGRGVDVDLVYKQCIGTRNQRHKNMNLQLIPLNVYHNQ